MPNSQNSLEDMLNEEMMDLIDGKVTVAQTSLTPPTESKTQNKEENSASDVVSPQLVIFYGPPCSGKTNHYEQEYSNTHIRICPPELYKQNENFSFHRLISLVTEHLSQNKNVVIDDQNRVVRTRISYLKAIKEQQDKNKLGIVQILAVCFHPLGGMVQCMWANEWAYAEHMNTSIHRENNFQPKPASEFEEWFHYGDNQPPTKQEGFNDVLTVRTKIHCNHTEKLEKEALFIDAASIFQFEKKAAKTEDDSESHDERDLKLITRTPQDNRLCYEKAFQQFREEHPSSVIIILVDEASFFPMILQLENSVEKQQQMVAKWRKQFRTYIENWATMIQTPISYVLAEYGCLEPTSFFSLPNHGMISYAQFIHQINLRTSFFICDQNSKNSLGFSFGFHTVISAFEFFVESGWNVKTKLKKFSFDYSANFPDFLDVVLYPHVTRPVDFFVTSGEFHSGIGRLHGTCIPSVSLSELCFSDEEIEMLGDRVDPLDLPRPHPIPTETGSQPNKFSSEATASSTQTNCASAPQQRVPALSEAYIRSIVTPVNFDRGMQYHKYDTIFNRRRKGFELSGMCKGSSAPPYEIVVNLSNRAAKIRSAYCTCPIRTGKCKHIAAFLLSWVHTKDKFKTLALESGSEIPPSPVPPTPYQLKTRKPELVSNQPNNEANDLQTAEPLPEPGLIMNGDKSEFMSSQPTSGKRKLPAWMRKNESPTKKSKTTKTTSNSREKNLPKEKTANNVKPEILASTEKNTERVEPHICETLHVSPQCAPVEPRKSSVRTVKEILADLDRELGSVPEKAADSDDEQEEIIVATSPKVRVSLKDRLSAAGLNI